MTVKQIQITICLVGERLGRNLPKIFWMALINPSGSKFILFVLVVEILSSDVEPWSFVSGENFTVFDFFVLTPHFGRPADLSSLLRKKTNGFPGQSKNNLNWSCLLNIQYLLWKFGPFETWHVVNKTLQVVCYVVVSVDEVSFNLAGSSKPGFQHGV